MNVNGNPSFYSLFLLLSWCFSLQSIISKPWHSLPILWFQLYFKCRILPNLYVSISMTWLPKSNHKFLTRHISQAYHVSKWIIFLCALPDLLLLYSCYSLQPLICSTPGFPVPHYLPEFAQTHFHWVSDAIQPSHPLLPPSPLTFNLSQHRGLFQRVGSSHQVARVLELQFLHQSFQWIFRTDFL